MPGVWIHFLHWKEFSGGNVFVSMNEQYGKCKPKISYSQTLCYNKAVAWFSVSMVVYNLYHTIDKGKIKVNKYNLFGGSMVVACYVIKIKEGNKEKGNW